jgi:transcription initiation factor TFIID TATA-box-binding protein
MEGWTSSHDTFPTIQNVVATVNFSTRIDLVGVAQKARNAEYSPKRFPGLVLRIRYPAFRLLLTYREPTATGIIFASGKCVLMGVRSEEAAKLAARKFGRFLVKLGQPARFRDFKVGARLSF